MDLVKKAVLADAGGGLYSDALMKTQVKISTVADYTCEFGLHELRARYVESQYANHITTDNVLVTSGVKEGLMLLALFFQRKEKSVAISDIAWPGFAKIFGGLDYDIKRYSYTSIRSIEDASKRCSVLIVNNPHNPTGFFFSCAEMKKIVAVTKENGCMLIIDECLAHYSFGDCERFSAQVDDTHVAVVDSLSKWAGMPGLRVGFINACKSLIDNLVEIKCRFLNPVSSVAQVTAAENMNNFSKWAKAEKEKSKKVLDTVSGLIAGEGYEVTGLLVQYMWLKAGERIQNGKLGIQGIEFKVVGGETFGADKQYARFNYRQCEQALNELV